jgi:ElaB/YqjD/DUF883 family membrane-anchored ribosome-binding protein
MEMEGNMAEPVRNDEPLSSMRFPESQSRPGPVPVTRTSDAAGLLPEHGTDQPLGEWPADVREDIAADRDRSGNEFRSTLDTVREKVRPVTDFLQDRASDLRHRFRVIRGRMQTGELQDDVKDRASEIADQASRQARVARNRAEFYARNYPLQFIAGAAAAGFAIGFLLRIGRDE